MIQFWKPMNKGKQEFKPISFMIRNQLYNKKNNKLVFIREIQKNENNTYEHIL